MNLPDSDPVHVEQTADGFPICHEWNPITDLPSDWPAYARPDIDESLRLWDAERASLRDTTKLRKLEERLATIWSIETGILENLYKVDRGTTETIVTLGLEGLEQFSTTGRITQEAAKIILDQRAALEFVFSYLKEERPLTGSYLKELHQLLLRNQDTTDAVDQFGRHFKTSILKGDWKKLPNNPVTKTGAIHEYCPPDFVQDEIDTLIRLHYEHEKADVRPEVEAAWLHHRFTQIHPFQDGNGRVARALATMVFLKAGFLPLVIRDEEHKDTYLDALEKADDGDLSLLINQFANIQVTDLEDAITEVRDLRSGSTFREIAAAAAEAAQRRVDEVEDQLAQHTDSLIEIAANRMREVAFELSQVFRESGLELETYVSKNDEQADWWWTDQIIKSAQQYRYFADLARFRRWAQLRLQIREPGMPRWHIIVSIHHKEVRSGVMAAVAFLTSSSPEAGEYRPMVLGSDHEFSFGRSNTALEDEFRSWLETSLSQLLNVWQSRV